MVAEANGNINTDKRDTEPARVEKRGKAGLEYRVSEIPPWYITLVYAVQQMLAAISGPITLVYIVHSAVCARGHQHSELLFAELLNTTIFMMGIAGFLQTTFGIRLPIVQGSSGAFIAPIIAMSNTKEFACPDLMAGQTGNITNDDGSKPWDSRLETIAGSLMAASAMQILLGITGIMGLVMDYIGPLTIIPTLSLIGLTIFDVATRPAQHQWGICALTVGLVVIFSVLLSNVRVPLPVWSKKKGVSYDKFRIFRLFPHISAIAIAWLLSYVLTVTDVFPPSTLNDTNLARTDAKPDVISQAEWFIFPYPGRISGIGFNVGVFAGMCAAVIASIIESVGDYYATAHSCQLPSPAKHAVNRGILMEGIASLISGSLGIGHATTSYSSVIGFIAITGMAARWVWQVIAVILILLGMFGKFGAALSLMPDPIIGGLTIVGMVISVGLSNIKHIDTKSPRNLMILAVSFMFGVMMPSYLENNPGIIDTGNADLDQVFTVLLSTGMLVGGVLGFTLDNILPGTKEERGIISFHTTMEPSDSILKSGENLMETYDLPYITPFLNRFKCLSYVPILPNYREEHYHCNLCTRCRTKERFDEELADTAL